MNKIFIMSLFILFSVLLSVSAIFVLFIKPSLTSECGKNIIGGGNSTIGGQFELTDTNNKKINSRDLITEPSLIYFGYSYCPDVCPFDLQRNAIAVDLLSDIKKLVTPVFITIDPARDTPNRLKEFSSFIHPKLIALTGSNEEVKTVMKLFKVYGQKSKESAVDNDTYLMDHSAFTYLVSSSNEFIDYFGRKISPEEMADRIACYFDEIN